MEPLPPPVTIVNPNAPAGYGEVLAAGDDRDPWRPSRGQQVVGLAVASVLLVVVGVTAAVDMVRTDRRLDREAVSSLRVVADGSFASRHLGAGTVRVALRNDGPHELRVLSARLVADGYGVVPVDRALPRGESTQLEFPDSATCGPQLLTEPASEVEVRLRTHRGQELTRREPLSPSAFLDVNHPARERCGYLPPEEAFSTRVVSAEIAGETLLVRLEVVNDSVLPMELVRLAESPGLSMTVSPAIPLSLAPQPSPGSREQLTQLVLRLKVEYCSIFLESAFRGGSDSLVRAWVSRGPTVIEVGLPLSLRSEEAMGQGIGFDPFELTGMLGTTSCPEFFYD